MEMCSLAMEHIDLTCSTVCLTLLTRPRNSLIMTEKIQVTIFSQEKIVFEAPGTSYIYETINGLIWT